MAYSSSPPSVTLMPRSWACLLQRQSARRREHRRQPGARSRCVCVGRSHDRSCLLQRPRWMRRHPLRRGVRWRGSRQGIPSVCGQVVMYIFGKPSYCAVKTDILSIDAPGKALMNGVLVCMQGFGLLISRGVSSKNWLFSEHIIVHLFASVNTVRLG